MHRPVTTAVLAGTTGLEARPEAEPALAGAISGSGPAAGFSSALVAGIPGGGGLPCGNDPELFFAESPEDVEFAKSLCLDCPARLACLAGAVERREPWGVWGGELFLRGEVVPRKRPRGRPRKTDVAA